MLDSVGDVGLAMLALEGYKKKSTIPWFGGVGGISICKVEEMVEIYDSPFWSTGKNAGQLSIGFRRV